MGKFMYANDRGNLPKPIAQHFTRNSRVHTHNTRQKQDFHIPFPKHNSHNILYKGPKHWLEIPQNIKNASSIESFNYRLKSYYVNGYE